MAQFDVHRNKGSQRAIIPYVVIVQSTLFEGYKRRVVVPLLRRSGLPKPSPSSGNRMNPVFRIEKIDVVLHPLDMVSVAVDQLGERVTSLADQGQTIVDALDELLTRSWG